MKYRSVFDIIGPVMIGPSSSHTAGAVRIGKIAREIFGAQPKEIVISFYGSFAETYQGHATDVAVIGGILQFETDDERIINSLEIAQEKGISINFVREKAQPQHPNTVKINLTNGDNKIELTAISIGGGMVQVISLNGFKLKLSGESAALIILHNDEYGTVSTVANILTDHKMNISHMEVSRLERGQSALMVIEVDQKISKALVSEIEDKENIQKVIALGV